MIYIRNCAEYRSAKVGFDVQDPYSTYERKTANSTTRSYGSRTNTDHGYKRVILEAGKGRGHTERPYRARHRTEYETHRLDNTNEWTRVFGLKGLCIHPGHIQMTHLEHRPTSSSLELIIRDSVLHLKASRSNSILRGSKDERVGRYLGVPGASCVWFSVCIFPLCHTLRVWYGMPCGIG